MRRWIGASVVGAMALAAVIGPGTSGALPDAASPKASPPIRYDTDGDGISQDLEATLATGRTDPIDVIVVMDVPATAARVQQLQAAVGTFGVTHRYASFPAFAATVNRGQVTALAHQSGVRHVDADVPVSITNDTAQASFGASKARVDAGVDGNADGNAATYSKDDLTLAVVDTGVDATHLDLDEGKLLAFRDVVNGRATAYDDNGHGTHVAATAVGKGDARSDLRYRGVAPGASLVSVKVLNAAGSGSSSTIAAGVDWVIQNKATYGIDAMSMSIGGAGCWDGSDVMSLAVNSANDAGLVSTIAAGNSGPGRCTVNSPGVATGALTVGAMSDLGANGFYLANFSSRGFTADGRIKPDVVGPGVSITSAAAGTTNGYTVMSGTSMATPFTAGVVLLMLDANPSLSVQQVKDRIRATAVDWGRGGDNRTAGSSGADVDYGAGRLDAYAAIESAAGHDIGEPPALPTHRTVDGTLSASGAQVDIPLDVTSTQWPIAATLLIPSITASSSNSPDFDLYLFAPNGSQVASATSTRRQDEFGYQPTTTGRYTLRVKDFSGSGAWIVDISAGTGADTTAPLVSSTSPASGAASVSRDTNVSVTFSEAMDTAATQAAFSLAPASNPAATIAGSFTWSGSTMTFDPTPQLDLGTQYVARVGTGARDAIGNQLASEYSWTFTTSSVTNGSATPASTTLETGSVAGGNASSLAADDNQFFRVNSTSTGTRTTSWYGTMTGVPNEAATLRIAYSGSNSRSCQQVVSIWRWTTSTWVQLDSRTVTNEVLLPSLAPTGSPADYVSGTTGGGDVRVRVRCTRSTRAFEADGDLLRATWT